MVYLKMNQYLLVAVLIATPLLMHLLGPSITLSPPPSYQPPPSPRALGTVSIATLPTLKLTSGPCCSGGPTWLVLLVTRKPTNHVSSILYQQVMQNYKQNTEKKKIKQKNKHLLQFSFGKNKTFPNPFNIKRTIK